MNPWATRRKGVIFLIFFVALLVVLGGPAYYFLKDNPVCDNGVQDGDESGVDCGGSCSLLCTPDTLPLITRGEMRVLKIATTTYVASILIENPNVDGEVRRAPYKISVYTSGTKEPVKTWSRETYIGRGSIFALFEGPFALTGSGPFRAVFEWGDNLVWEKTEAPLPLLAVDNMSLSQASTSPRLEAKLVNRDENTINNIELVAVLSDTNGNTIASGKTFVDSISSGESLPISFSWPEAFLEEPVSIRVLPHVLPDKSYLK